MRRRSHGRGPIARLARGLGVLVIVGLGTGVAEAAAAAPVCSCGTLESQIEQADAVFTGRVRDLSLEATGPAGVEQLWNVEVDESFVGPDAPVLAVSTGGELSNCRVDVEPGERYGIVAFWRNGHLATSLCGVTTPSALRAAINRSDGGLASPSVVLAASAVALVGFAALAVHRRRRAGS